MPPYLDLIMSYHIISLKMDYLDIQILFCDIKGQYLDIIRLYHDVKVSYSYITI